MLLVVDGWLFAIVSGQVDGLVVSRRLPVALRLDPGGIEIIGQIIGRVRCRSVARLELRFVTGVFGRLLVAPFATGRVWVLRVDIAQIAVVLRCHACAAVLLCVYVR